MIECRPIFSDVKPIFLFKLYFLTNLLLSRPTGLIYLIIHLTKLNVKQ